MRISEADERLAVADVTNGKSALRRRHSKQKGRLAAPFRLKYGGVDGTFLTLAPAYALLTFHASTPGYDVPKEVSKRFYAI